jgi:leader peptidase (prepilin peptidase) / N-methyltransferase
MPTVDFPTWFLSLLLAPFGLVLGSFANVLIYRLPQEDPKERDVVRRSSHCPGCGADIKWRHNIPLLGWLWLRGRCAACGWHIPVRYPLVELLGGLVLAGSVWVFPFGTLIWAKGVICGFALLVLFFTDLTEFMLPDVLQFPLMVLGVLFTLPQILRPEWLVSVWGPGTSILRVEALANGLQPAPALATVGARVTWQDSLLGLAIGYGVPWLLNLLYRLLRKTDGIGMGDFKMLAWLGAFWGWGPMLGILFGGAFLGSAVGLPLILLRRAKATTMLPFGCALALSTPVVVFFGRELWLGYLAFLR